ncbi:winged helix-turn-helix transcriptional regulator [Streptomyces sp. NPDC017941]|uniref:winged helix-turn-helix transcriptional regulator n=1 Tax=Streptomyces sp. NPDC017941 TaxID=3365018 RepID=UPI003797F8C8
MDYAAAWNKIGTGTKTARSFSTDRINRVTTATGRALDVAAPVCAPFAARWDAEADRRTKLRTPENLKALLAAQRSNTLARSTAATASSQRKAAKAASKNPLNGGRRAARTADKAARGHAKVARTDLKTARRNYPATMRQLAVRAHAAHTIPAGLASYVMSSAEHWTMWPAGTSLSLIGLNVAALAVGRRKVATDVDDSMTAEEKRLASRLDPTYWVPNADARGLSGTVPTPAKLTAAGLVSHVRLDDRWTPKAFKAKTDEIRALLGARTDLRVEVKAGSHGDRATIILRTRSASDGISLSGWKPGDCWAIDTVTGETIPVPLGKRMLIAGTSGAGKSYSARPLMAEASEPADHRLVIFDRKYVEARTWEHRARTAVELDEMREVVQELIAEGEERLKFLPRGEDVIKISPERPRITVFVDETGELLQDCKTKYEDEDGKKRDYQDVIEGLRTIARKYRAAEIILVPATQKPTLSGDGHGLDSQIAGQMTIKLGLAVANQTDAQTVFGRSDWPAHDLPMPGYALLFDQDKGPKQRRNPIKLRFMTPQEVIALPSRPIWSRSSVASAVPAPAAPLRLVKDATPAPAAAPAAAVPADLTDNQAAVLKAVQGGTSTNAEIAKAIGINPGSVDRAVKALVKRGLLAKDGTTIRVEVAA